MSENSSPSITTRLFALTGFVTVVSFAAIIAGVPINLPRDQHPIDPSNPQQSVDDGSNAWQIVATAMVLALSPALAFAYGYLHGSNLHELLRNVTVIGALVTFLWILFSFSLAYGKDAKYNGIMGYPVSFYFFHNTQDQNAWMQGPYMYVLSNSIFAVYELGFAVVTATLIAISLAGRVNLNSFIIFIMIWHLIVYTPVAHIVWTPSGALKTNWVQDFSGSLVVHILSSATSISLHLILGKNEIPKLGPIAHSKEAFNWTLVVYFLWFGFNAGKAHNTILAPQSVVNTIAATFISALMGYFYNTALDKPVTGVTLSNALLIGLVGITPASGYVTVGGALVIGTFTYLFTIIVANFLIGEGNGVNESLSTLSIHSLAGTCGYVWTAILSYKFVNPLGWNGLTYGRGVPIGFQLAGLVAVWALAFICTFLLAWLVNLVSPLKQVTGFDAEYKPAQTEGGEPQGEIEVVEQNKEV